MKTRRLILFLAVAALAACDARDPVADEANNGEPAEIEALPPDESVATPTNELENGVTNEAAGAAGEPIPASLHGRWALTPADCRRPVGGTEGAVLVTSKELRFYESIARPVANIETTADSISADFAFTGDGTRWTRHQALQVQEGNKLVRTQSRPAASFTYARCTS